MLTFEDFFAKKKIDLQALEHDNKELYQEFYQHYHAMGEKSFDHTKKFWFNRLRKSYKLNEPEPLVQKTEAVIEPTTAAKTSTTLGFKPKFKAKPKTEEEVIGSKETVPPIETPSVENKPAGFKPRFKAGVTKAAPTEGSATSETPTPPAETPNVENKPTGFKPRFKTGVTKSAPTEGSATSETPTPPAEIPSAENKLTGFKPRFKAGVTKIKKGDDPET